MFSSTTTSIPMHFPITIKYGSGIETNPLMEAFQRPYQALGSVFNARSLGNGSTTWQSTLRVPATVLADRQWNSGENDWCQPHGGPLMEMLYMLYPWCGHGTSARFALVKMETTKSDNNKQPWKNNCIPASTSV
jgi:hypothetical protein